MNAAEVHVYHSLKRLNEQWDEQFKCLHRDIDLYNSSKAARINKDTRDVAVMEKSSFATNSEEAIPADSVVRHSLPRGLDFCWRDRLILDNPLILLSSGMTMLLCYLSMQ